MYKRNVEIIIKERDLVFTDQVGTISRVQQINIIIIIITIRYKIYKAPCIICKEIALRRYTNIIKCKIVLHEQNTHTFIFEIFRWYLYDEYAPRKRLVFTFFLNMERLLHFLMVNGRLFHRVAAAYTRILYSDLFMTGCPCREFKTGVISSISTLFTCQSGFKCT